MSSWLTDLFLFQEHLSIGKEKKVAASFGLVARRASMISRVTLFPIDRARRVCRTVEKIMAHVRMCNMEVPGQGVQVESRRMSGGVEGRDRASSSSAQSITSEAYLKMRWSSVGSMLL